MGVLIGITCNHPPTSLPVPGVGRLPRQLAQRREQQTPGSACHPTKQKPTCVATTVRGVVQNCHHFHKRTKSTLGEVVNGRSALFKNVDRMCIYFYLINQLDPVVHFRNVEVFITFCNFECIITA